MYMYKKRKLHSAIVTALGVGFAANPGYVAAQSTGKAAESFRLEEVVVTATKRAASAQDIPVAVQAVSSDTIDDLGIETFDEYVKYLPNVVQQGRGPGQSEVYIRGVASQQLGNELSSVNGSAPTVAMYLDEQPISFGGRNIDVYAADLERVEVLPGPQGTLFGASSQAGTVRLISKKPNHNAFSAGFRGAQAWTTGGEQSTASQFYVNIPFSDDFAVRAVVYNDRQGGWIDNVPGQFNSDDSALIQVINRNQIFGAGIAAGTAMPRADNSDLIEKDFNDAVYSGARISASLDITDKWNVLVQHTAQSLETEGAFEYAPYLDGHDESSTAKFAPNENNDEFDISTWTLTGRVGGLDLVYTGGFVDREVSSIIDYTDYTYGGGYQVYYLCTGGSYSARTACFDPKKQYLDNTSAERLTNELRVSSDTDARFSFTAGVYLDDSEINSTGQFQYFGAADAGFDTAARAGGLTQVDGVNEYFGHGASTIFMNDFTRTEKQIAFFGEVKFRVTDEFALTVGARNYEIETELEGATNSSFYCKGLDASGASAGDMLADYNGDGVPDSVAVMGPDGQLHCDGVRADNNVTKRFEDLGAAGEPGIDSDGSVTIDDTIMKFTADWTPTDDLLIYATWSEGFRPPALNRNAGQASSNQTGVFSGYKVPAFANTDELTNREVGIKSDLLDGTLRLNATFYDSDVKNIQSQRFDPINIAFLQFVENVGDADIRGLDMDFQWAASANFTLFGAASFVDSELTRINGQLEGIAVPVGSELPYTPEFSFNLRGRYDFRFNGFDAYGQLGLVYTGESKSGTVGNALFIEETTELVYGRGSDLKIETYDGNFVAGPAGESYQLARYVQEDYTLVNAAFGFGKAGWNAELYVDNLFDESGQVYISTEDYSPSVVTNRPRTIGLRFRYDFE